MESEIEINVGQIVYHGTKNGAMCTLKINKSLKSYEESEEFVRGLTKEIKKYLRFQNIEIEEEVYE